MKVYMLNGKAVVPCDMDTWARTFGAGDKSRRVAFDEVGDSHVSTVFLGLDHRFSGVGPPILFETMVFGGPLNEEMERYSTYDEAESGHLAMVERVRNGSL